MRASSKSRHLWLLAAGAVTSLLSHAAAAETGKLFAVGRADGSYVEFREKGDHYDLTVQTTHGPALVTLSPQGRAARGTAGAEIDQALDEMANVAGKLPSDLAIGKIAGMKITDIRMPRAPVPKIKPPALPTLPSFFLDKILVSPFNFGFLAPLHFDEIGPEQTPAASGAQNPPPQADNNANGRQDSAGNDNHANADTGKDAQKGMLQLWALAALGVTAASGAAGAFALFAPRKQKAAVASAFKKAGSILGAAYRAPGKGLDALANGALTILDYLSRGPKRPMAPLGPIEEVAPGMRELNERIHCARYGGQPTYVTYAGAC